MLYQLHTHESRKLEDAEYRYFDTEDSLHKYATVIDEHLLNFDYRGYLIQATGRVSNVTKNVFTKISFRLIFPCSPVLFALP